MKLIDRYVAVTFLKNYLLAFAVLVGMYVVLDMVFNFDEFAEVKARLPGAGAFVYYVAEFYFYQVFLYYVHLAGIIPVVAAAFTLMRMIRFNEVSALLSAGVPMLRLAMPIIVASLLLNGLLWADQELVIPNLIHKVTRSHDYAAGSSQGYPVAALREEAWPAPRPRPVRGNAAAAAAAADDDGAASHPPAAAPDPRSTRTLFAARFHPNAEPPLLEHVSVITQDADHQPVEHLKASRATWDAKARLWRLTDGRLDTNLSPRNPDPPRSIPADVWVTTITPEEIRLHRRGDFVELLSTEQIDELLQRPRSYGREHLLRVKHTRGPAQVAMNMVLLLLALASVLTRDPQQLKTAAVRCIVWCGLCLAASFVAQSVIDAPPQGLPALAEHWPALMAWAPIFLFAPLAVLLLDRVRT